MGESFFSGGFEALRANCRPEGSILCFRGRGGVGTGEGTERLGGALRHEDGVKRWCERLRTAGASKTCGTLMQRVIVIGARSDD